MGKNLAEMKILITNAYSSKNKGDAGIIISMLRNLRDQTGFKKAEFSISSVDSIADADLYSAKVVPSFQSLKNSLSSNNYLACLVFIACLFPLTIVWAFFYKQFGKDIKIPPKLRELVQAYVEADIIIAAGGGYLYTTSTFFGNIILFINLFSFYFGILLGKPVYLYSQSIGPFASQMQAWFIKKAIRKVRLIEVREDLSRTLLASWGIQTPVYNTLDAAFLLPDEDCPEIFSEVKEEKMWVGITARKWFRDSDRQQAYEKILAEFIDWLIDDLRALVFFIPQVTYEKGDDDDRMVARAIKKRVFAKDSVCLIEEELTPQQIKRFCGKMNFFVGTRMHSNIYALSMFVPTLAIAYQPKTRGIMMQLNLDDFVVQIEKMVLAALQDKFRHLVASQTEIKKCLRVKIPDVSKAAALSGQLIAQDFFYDISKGL